MSDSTNIHRYKAIYAIIQDCIIILANDNLLVKYRCQPIIITNNILKKNPELIFFHFRWLSINI